MNKHLASAAVVVSMLALLGGCNEEKEPQKPAPQFGVVELAKLYQDSKLGKAGSARVEELENKAMSILQGLQEKLEKARAGKDEAEIAKVEKELQTHLYYLQNIIKQDQEHVMNVFQTELTKAFDKYRADHGLMGVFSSDTLLSVSPEVDVTAAVQAIVDQNTPDFGPLPTLEMPPLPEPANATPLKEEPAPAEAAPEAAPAPAAEAAPAPAAK